MACFRRHGSALDGALALGHMDRVGPELGEEGREAADVVRRPAEVGPEPPFVNVNTTEWERSRFCYGSILRQGGP